MKTLPENILKSLDRRDRARLGKAGLTSAEANAKFEAKNERELQKQIANYLRLKGIWFAQSRTDKRTTNGNGCPDFLLVAHCAYPVAISEKPLPIAIEAKFGSGFLSQEQVIVRNKMVSDGWQYFVVYSLVNVKTILGL